MSLCALFAAMLIADKAEQPSTRGGGHVRAPDGAIGSAGVHKAAPGGNAQDVTLDQLHVAHMARHRARQIPLSHDVTPRTARQTHKHLVSTVHQSVFTETLTMYFAAAPSNCSVSCRCWHIMRDR